MSLFGFGQGITLKELLENPNLQNPPDLSKDGVSKEKGGNYSGGYDFSSAFLGPNLWNTSNDDENFKLEYMDLDEFLSENGIGGLADDSNSGSAEHTKKDSPIHINPGSTSPIHLNPGSTSPASSYTSESVAIPPSEIFEKQQVPESPNDTRDYSSADLQSSSDSLAVKCLDDKKSEPTTVECPGIKTKAWSSLLVDNLAGSVSPPRVQVDFKVSEQELALASIPGQEGFDPVKRRFTEEELKPQPIIKKSKKIFVPEDLKDTKYWTRRKKNNVAAKRSRDARRVKENQIAMRASFLESENETMKQELILLKRENTALRNSLSKYEALENKK